MTDVTDDKKLQRCDGVISYSYDTGAGGVYKCVKLAANS